MNEKLLSDVPAGAVGICHTEYSFISWTIRWLTKSWANHTLLYFGSGRHETVEAEAKGVCIDTLNNRLNNKNKFKLYANRNLTVDQLQVIKSYAYSRVGKPYDYEGIAQFLGRIVLKFMGIHTNFNNNKNADFCSEMATNSYGCACMKISNKRSDETAPADNEMYFESADGISAGWYLVYKWNC